jgi:hypothetical protein
MFFHDFEIRALHLKREMISIIQSRIITRREIGGWNGAQKSSVTRKRG